MSLGTRDCPGGLYLGYVSPFLLDFEGLEVIPRDADTRQVVDKADATPPIVERQKRLGLFFLASDLAAVRPEEAHVPRPFPERPVIGHALEFDGDAAEGRIDVEDGDGERRAVMAAVIQSGDGAKRDRPRRIFGPSILTEGVPLGRLDAGTREDIVKIVEYMELPGLADLGLGEAGFGEPGRGGRGGFGLDERSKARDGAALET